MEQVLQERRERDVDWNSRMGREEMADSSFMMEKDVKDELDFCMEVELSLAGQVSVGSDKYPGEDELDWFESREHVDSLSNSQEQREGSTGGHGGSQSQEDIETEADSGPVEREVKLDDQTKESKKKKMKQVFDVYLWPVEESGGHVRITLEEVEQYYRFSCCCHWLCGTCQVFYCFLSSFLFFASNHDSSLLLLPPYCIYLICGKFLAVLLLFMFP